MTLHARQHGHGSVSALIGVVVGLVVGIAVAVDMPGAACRDGSSSQSIGHQGACSHHGGVVSGSGGLGVPAGFFAGLLASILAGNMIDPLKERREEARLARPARKRQVNAHDKEAVLRAAMLSSSEVEFSYQVGGIVLEQRRVFPRWLKMAIVEGEETLCLMASQGPTGDQRPMALSRMSSIKIASVVDRAPTLS